MADIDERQAAIKRLEERHALYQRLFGTADGQEVLKDIERNCYTNTTTFSTDALQIAYREGMRCVALHIRTMLELDTEKMKDAVSEQATT